MKKDIHPKYEDAIVTCACGEVWHIKSTRPEYKVGICAKCHPFFTGKQKFVDTAGLTSSTAVTRSRPDLFGLFAENGLSRKELPGGPFLIV